MRVCFGFCINTQFGFHEIAVMTLIRAEKAALQALKFCGIFQLFEDYRQRSMRQILAGVFTFMFTLSAVHVVGTFAVC